MARHRLPTCGLAVVALAFPAAAAAAPVPTLAPLKPCYVATGTAATQREPVVLAASGFTPFSTVDVTVDGTLAVARVQVDASGSFSGTVPAPVVGGTLDRPFTVLAAESTNPALVVRAVSRVSPLLVTASPQTAAPSARVRFTGQGFTGTGAVWAHYVFGERVRKTVRIGAPARPCGGWTVRRVQLPVGKPPVGDWTIQFDQSRKYAANPAGLFVRLPLHVTAVRRGARRAAPAAPAPCCASPVRGARTGRGDGHGTTGRQGRDHHRRGAGAG
jgi:hypothetical protein